MIAGVHLACSCQRLAANTPYIGIQDEACKLLSEAAESLEKEACETASSKVLSVSLTDFLSGDSLLG